jgi:hypothetical protein
MYVKTAMGREIPACEFKEGLVLIRYVGVQIIKPEDTMSQWRDRK